MTPSPAGANAALPIAILISGRGSNMQAIAGLAAAGKLPVEVRTVISDQPAAAGLATAAAMNIPTHALSPRDFADRPSYDAALIELLSRYRPGAIALAGFMRILTATFIDAYAGRILNIHPSLLPRHRGLHTHRRALEAGDTVHGASVHFVTEELDGGPVIVQAQVAVRPGDTETSLSARVQQQEHRIYPEVLGWLATGRLVLRDNRAWLDGKQLDAPRIDHATGD